MVINYGAREIRRITANADHRVPPTLGHELCTHIKSRPRSTTLSGSNVILDTIGTREVLDSKSVSPSSVGNPSRAMPRKSSREPVTTGRSIFPVLPTDWPPRCYYSRLPSVADYFVLTLCPIAPPSQPWLIVVRPFNGHAEHTTDEAKHKEKRSQASGNTITTNHRGDLATFK
jgi:hypothetical protein